VLVNNDEIEVACDALWFAKTNGVMDETQQQLFDRLQVIRVGDYGGTASTELDVDEIAAIVRALRFSDVGVDLDDDERALLKKLTTEPLAAGNGPGTS
jgi:hypothetical protein